MAIYENVYMIRRKKWFLHKCYFVDNCEPFESGKKLWYVRIKSVYDISKLHMFIVYVM